MPDTKKKKKTQRWRAVRGQRPREQSQTSRYKRMMDAEVRLGELRCPSRDSARRRLPSPRRQPAQRLRIEREDDLYLSTLAPYVAALDGNPRCAPCTIRGR